MQTQRFRRALVAALLAILTAAVFAPQAPAALAAPLPPPGTLDSSFAGFTDDGIVFQSGIVTTGAIALQPDGKTIWVGFTGTANQLGVYRYQANGLLDTSFDVDGKAIFSNMFTASRVILQPDGKIVVGGTLNNDFQLARLTPAGALDTSFDFDGWVSDVDSQLAILSAIMIQFDGRIVACGSAQVGGDSDFGVARYTSGGARDTSFSGDGKLTIPFGGEDSCEDVVQQGNDMLVFAGARASTSIFGDDDFAVARVWLNGTLDNEFDGDGKLTTGFGGDESATDVALQPGGKIVVLGSRFNMESYIARYLPTGALDPSFDGDGKRTIKNDRLTDLTLQPDGKLLALGYHNDTGDNFQFALYRLENNGALDMTFDFDGVAWLDFGGYRDKGTDLALLPDGRILVAGMRDTTGVLARLWQDGTKFDAGGQQIHTPLAPPVYPPGTDAITSAVLAQPDGSLLVVGELRGPANVRSDAFVTRFLANGQLDRSFGVDGTVLMWIGNFNAARAVAVQPDGKIVIGGYSTWCCGWDEFMVARLLPNGAYDRSFGENGNNYRLANFSTGASMDQGYALALAPDGKIVVAGTAWNGTSQIWGVARWNSNGTPDNSFDGDGKAFVDLGPGSLALSVVVQPDLKIVLGGKTAGHDFALARVQTGGALDSTFGSYRNGTEITDMGGYDGVTALALASNGWIYASGYSWRGGADDFALAQYQPNGVLPLCPAGQKCGYWPEGKRFISIGGSDTAYAIALRGDNQLVAAGCTDWHTGAVQVSTTEIDQPIVFSTDFAGDYDCAFGVQFVGANKDKIVLAGQQAFADDNHIALARFQTTAQKKAVSAGAEPAAEPAGEPAGEPVDLSGEPADEGEAPVDTSEVPVDTVGEPEPADMSGEPVDMSGEPTPQP